MADKMSMAFTRKSIRKHSQDFIKLLKIIDKHARQDVINFLKNWIKQRIVRFVIKKIATLVTKIVVREVAILGGTAIGAAAGGAPAPAVFIVGNVLLVIWTIIDISSLVIDVRTFMTERKSKRRQSKKEKPDFSIKGQGKNSDPTFLEDLMAFIQQTAIADVIRAIRNDLRSA